MRRPAGMLLSTLRRALIRLYLYFANCLRDINQGSQLRRVYRKNEYHNTACCRVVLKEK
jgi:hypothetical protein